MVATRAPARGEPERFGRLVGHALEQRRITLAPRRATMSGDHDDEHDAERPTIRSVTVDAVSGLTPNLMSRW